MPFDPDDARLTAYVLGELDEADRVEFELLIAESTDAQRFVEETHATAGLLAAQLRHEARPGLASEQHQAIEKTLEMRAKSLHQFRPGRPWLTLRRFAQLAVTAGIIVFVAALVLPAYRVAREGPTELVLATDPPGVDTYVTSTGKASENSPQKKRSKKQWSLPAPKTSSQGLVRTPAWSTGPGSQARTSPHRRVSRLRMAS